MKIISGTCLIALLSGGCTPMVGGTTVASCVPVVLQDAQNLHQLEGGLAAVSASPVTVMPPPVMTQPPPVVVTPTPNGPVVTPATPTPPTVTPTGPSGGPTIVTPTARSFRKRSSHVSDKEDPSPAAVKAGSFDLHKLFGPDGHLKSSGTVGL